MARVTIEDCINVVQNRFELVLLAAQRARNISAGQEILVDRDNDKNAVVALREIAEDNLNLEDLKSNIVKGVNRHDVGVSEDEKLDSLKQEQELSTGLNKTVDLGFSEIEQEEVTDEDVMAAAEGLFSNSEETENSEN